MHAFAADSSWSVPTAAELHLHPRAINVAGAGVALEDIEQCVVHLGRHVVLRSGSLFFAGPVWSVHADERRPDGLTYACRRHDVGRIDYP